MACIGGDKLTKDRIRANKVFSANLVSRSMLPLADYLGNTEGYSPEKMDIPIEIERGAVLEVPVLRDSPWVFELEVQRAIPLDDGEVFLCKIRNTLVDRELREESVSIEERLSKADPVAWVGGEEYFAFKAEALGKAGDWKDRFRKEK